MSQPLLTKYVLYWLVI